MALRALLTRLANTPTQISASRRLLRYDKMLGEQIRDLSRPVQVYKRYESTWTKPIQTNAQWKDQSENRAVLPLSVMAESLFADIRKELQSEQTELEEIATYYFDGQGKAYRPMIVILIGRAYNEHMGCPVELSQAQRVVAMVAEMIHTSSLVHDDVIDSADTRRGKKSVNVVYGQRKSILAGDYILSRASQMLARLENEEILVVLSHVSNNS